MIKIINKTGLSRDTKFICSETGEDLAKKLGINYGATLHLEEGFVVLKCAISSVESEIEVEKARWHIKHPFSGSYQAVSEIKFQDGSVVKFNDVGKPIFMAAGEGQGDGQGVARVDGQWLRSKIPEPVAKAFLLSVLADTFPFAAMDIKEREIQAKSALLIMQLERAKSEQKRNQVSRANRPAPRARRRL
jgi:hypothetical protein